MYNKRARKNSKQDLSRLDYRKKWDQDLCTYLKTLEEKKPVLFCGDLNVAHTEIDLARPKPNYNKSAGFTQTEKLISVERPKDVTQFVGKFIF